MRTKEGKKFKILIKWGEVKHGNVERKRIILQTKTKKNQLQQQPLSIIKCILRFNHAQMTMVFR